MALGKIPRFSPSFSPAELLISARNVFQPPEDEPVVSHFERTFAEYVGHKHAVMVPSARFGFWLLLQGYGIGPGDEVIFPALTYFAIPGFGVTAGVTPRFADIGLTTHVMDPESFRARITDKTKAVVPTHLFGTPAPLEPIIEIAHEHGIKVIEDCAQATGARYKGRRVGGWGDASYYTFGLTKNITTLKGAMITTDDDELAAYVRGEIDRSTPADLKKMWQEAVTGAAMMVATHPLVYPFTLHPVIRLGNKLGDDPLHERFGEAEHMVDEVPGYYYASRPRAVQAAVGLKQLERIDELNGARARNGHFLDEHLQNIPGLTVPSYPKGADPIYMSFVVHHKNREGFARALRRRGVDTTIGYMSNCSDNDLFRQWSEDCPNATEAFETLLHIPVHPNLRDEDLHHIAESVRAAAHEVDR